MDEGAIPPTRGHVSDDCSNTFHSRRGHLVDGQGRRYVEFLRTLQPDFNRVRRDLALGYGLLMGSAALAVVMSRFGAPPWLIVAVAALLIGYWIAYIQLFIHEGAHYNLHPAPERNDRLCNLLVGWMIGAPVAQYRIVHFQHHRALGTVNDSEATYFSPLNFGFFFKTLFGVRVLEVLFERRRIVDAVQSQLQQAAKKAATGRSRQLMMIGGLAAHGAIILVLWWFGGIAPALAWILGVAMAFPFWGALRQWLEHRRIEAKANVDYRTTDHGAFTRMFGSGPFSSTFGGAGFNRHLLHHWEPKVSYTNLPALEQFLMDTEMGLIIEARRISYGNAFISLMKSS